MDRIIDYMVNELKQPQILAKRSATKLCKYDDIKDEFINWLDTREYSSDGLEIDGYTAAKIYELAPFMNGVGVYSFLVTLRDNPEFAHETIKAGFPRK